MVYSLSKDEIVEIVSSDMPKTQECKLKLDLGKPKNYNHGL